MTLPLGFPRPSEPPLRWFARRLEVKGWPVVAIDRDRR